MCEHALHAGKKATNGSKAGPAASHAAVNEWKPLQQLLRQHGALPAQQQNQQQVWLQFTYGPEGQPQIQMHWLVRQLCPQSRTSSQREGLCADSHSPGMLHACRSQHARVTDSQLAGCEQVQGAAQRAQERDASPAELCAAVGVVIAQHARRGDLVDDLLRALEAAKRAERQAAACLQALTR